MLSYFKLLLLLHQIVQKGIRWKLLKYGLSWRQATAHLFYPRLGAVLVRVVEPYSAIAAVGNVPEGTAVPVLLSLSPSH